MNKKIGKFKLWHLIAIGAAVGLAYYLYNRNSQGINPEEVVGGTGTGAFGPIDPNTGVPYAFESGLGSGAAGAETLGNFLGQVQQLREAGFFGTPEVQREVIETPGPEGPGAAAVAHAKAEAAKARKEAKAARQAAKREHKAHTRADHRSTQKPHSTGAAAHVPHTHHSPAHPSSRYTVPTSGAFGTPRTLTANRNNRRRRRRR